MTLDHYVDLQAIPGSECLQRTFSRICQERSITDKNIREYIANKLVARWHDGARTEAALGDGLFPSSTCADQLRERPQPSFRAPMSGSS